MLMKAISCEEFYVPRSDSVRIVPAVSSHFLCIKPTGRAGKLRR